MTSHGPVRLTGVTLAAYGSCTGVEVPLGPGVTVVLGVNEAGKSTALAALSDLLWGIPLRTPYAFLHSRPYLRIDATVVEPTADGVAERHLVRRAGGLLEADLATPARCPWDPDGTGTAEWWRTRLGLDLEQLRAGGEELVSGEGDLAEAVFAAREGRSARAVLDQLRRSGEDLFKPHGGAKSVRLRQAFTAYQRAVADRDEKVTRSDDVTLARQEADRLAAEVESAEQDAADAARRVRMAEEDVRVIASVLELRRARDDLAAIDAEGPRLAPHELAGFDATCRAAAEARDELAALDGQATALQAAIDELAVDEALLADAATIGRLHPQAAARIADLRRAEDEFGPAAAQAAESLVDLLAQLGVATTLTDVDAAVDGVRVGGVLQSELSDIAERLRLAHDELATATRRRDEALADLAARGIVIDPAGGAAPRQDLMERWRTELVDARMRLATKVELLEQARVRLAELRAADPAPMPPAALTVADVHGARAERDRAWQALRSTWLSDVPAPPKDRADLADRVEQAIATADTMADDEAGERARVHAHDARLAAHVDGVEAARTAVADAEQAVADAIAARDAAERDWSRAWAALDLADAPTTDSAPELLSMIAAAFQQESLRAAATTAVEAVTGEWERVVERAGLPEGTTTVSWQARLDILERIDALVADRREALDGERSRRLAWQGFADEVLTLLLRHGGLAGDDTPTPADLEHALGLLESRRGREDVARARRDALAERLLQAQEARPPLTAAVVEEEADRDRLAAAYGTDPGAGVDALAERARRATDPLEREADALFAISSGLDAGSSLDEVLDRLRDVDAIAADQARSSALDAQRDAQAEVSRLVELRTSARDRLRALESAGSAAEAEAEVEQQRAELIDLVERWSVITLQRRLLEKALAALGADDTRPLLDRAGRILDRLTGGRYVALRAEEGATSRTLAVLRADGTAWATGQLSEGTADQVYFALRMAGVAELHDERMAAGLPALPCVLDDVLMAFDDDRTREALEVLHELADGLQVIVFTHHQRVADTASTIDGVAVSVLPTPAAIEGALDGDLVRATAQQDAPKDPTPRRAAQRADGDLDPATVRAWAIENGIEVSAKGRVPAHVVEQYRAAHG